MASEIKVSRIDLASDGRHALLRCRTADRIALEKQLFHRYPGREWGTFFRFGYRRTPWGLALSFVDPIFPGAGDLDRQSPLTVFREQYSRRAFGAAANSSLAIGVVHSHPQGYGTFPSPLDDDMDTYFAREFAAYSKGAPYCSFILQRSDRSGLTFSGRVFDRGEWIPVKNLLSIGSVLERTANEVLNADALQPQKNMESESNTERLSALFGKAAATRLENATVGIIGCSGTGSPASEVLARARVGEFVFVDPQRLSPSNLERLHGAEANDLEQPVRPYKVDLMRRMVRAVNRTARVTSFVGNILHENVVDELLRCDVLLGCTDSYHGRVALSDLANLYLLPSIDVGILMDGKDGKVTSQLTEFNQYDPNLPCAFCSGLVDGGALAEELMTEEERQQRRAAAQEAIKQGIEADQYWKGRPRQLNTVGYLTTAAGSLAAGYAEGWLTGAFSLPHERFQFDVGLTRLAVVAPPRSAMPHAIAPSTLGGPTRVKRIGMSSSLRTGRDGASLR